MENKELTFCYDAIDSNNEHGETCLNIMMDARIADDFVNKTPLSVYKDTAEQIIRASEIMKFRRYVEGSIKHVDFSNKQKATDIQN